MVTNASVCGRSSSPVIGSRRASPFMKCSCSGQRAGAGRAAEHGAGGFVGVISIRAQPRAAEGAAGHYAGDDQPPGRGGPARAEPMPPLRRQAVRRPVRIKISGCMRSMAGAEAFCGIRSNLPTAARHGITMLDALTEQHLDQPGCRNVVTTRQGTYPVTRGYGSVPKWDGCRAIGAVGVDSLLRVVLPDYHARKVCNTLVHAYAPQ